MSFETRKIVNWIESNVVAMSTEEVKKFMAYLETNFVISKIEKEGHSGSGTVVTPIDLKTLEGNRPDM